MNAMLHFINVIQPHIALTFLSYIYVVGSLSFLSNVSVDTRVMSHYFNRIKF